MFPNAVESFRWQRDDLCLFDFWITHSFLHNLLSLASLPYHSSSNEIVMSNKYPGIIGFVR